MGVWEDLREERKFERIQHLYIENQSVFSYITALQREAQRGLGEDKDIFGSVLTQGEDVVELPADMYKKLAKHLRSSRSIQNLVIQIIRQIFLALVDCLDSKTYLKVMEIVDDEPGFDKSKPSNRQYGCFARDDIPEGTVLAQYTGELRREVKITFTVSAALKHIALLARGKWMR